MRYISLFSGIEAASVAWRDLDGWEPVAFCEIDKFPSAVLAYRFPDVPNLGDITKVDWKGVIEEYGAVDLIVGGSPCQSFSIAGGRESLDGESRLMFEYIRAIEEAKPRWFLWENVPGVLNTRDDAFGCLLRALQEIGYSDIAYRVLDAQFFGVAQRRRRVFVVGNLIGKRFCSAAILFDSASLSRFAVSNTEKREELSRSAKKHSYKTICMAGDTARAAVNVDVCGTLLAGSGSAPIVLKVRGGSDTYIKRDGTVGTAGKGALLEHDVTFTLAATQDMTLFVDDMARYLTPIECERLQGFPDNWTLIPYRGKPANECPDAPRYKALGNSMAVPVMKWLGQRIQLVENILQEISV